MTMLGILKYQHAQHRSPDVPGETSEKDGRGESEKGFFRVSQRTRRGLIKDDLSAEH